MKRTVKICLSALLIVLTVITVFVIVDRGFFTKIDLELFAHRGYKGEYPENTMVAFEGAMDAGFDGIEFDVFETKSGDILTFHDSTTDRMCEISDSIYNVSLNNRENYPIVTGKNIEQYDSLLIPTFEETVAAMKNRNAERIFINLKGLDAITDQGIAQIDEILRKYDMVDKSLIFCGRISLLKKFEEKGLHIGRLYVGKGDPGSTKAMKSLEECIEADVKTFIVFYPNKVNQEIVNKCRDNGIEIGVYKVKKKKEAVRLNKLGVDFIFSDYLLF